VLHLLESFCAVARLGSLNRAADELHISQPALTKQMRALEQELGVTLLNRSPKGIHLTPAGEEVFFHARRALAAAADCRNVASRYADPQAGHVRLGAGLTLVLFTLPPLLAAYRLQRPRVEVVVQVADSRTTAARVAEGALDLGLLTSPVTANGLRTTPLFVDPLVLVAPPGHPLSGRQDLSMADLHGQALVGAGKGTGLRGQVDRILADHGIVPRFVMEFDNLEAAKGMVLVGLGLCLLPLSSVQADAAAGRLTVHRLIDWPDPGRTISLVTRRTSPSEGPQAELARLLVERLRQR
jgi:DNA-binding transcriptional LysR family regulator